jgi:hypothetical protein
MSRIEELADKIINVAHDKESVVGALREVYESAFAEGYERKGFDIRFQKEKRDEQINKGWQKERERIIFKGQ